MNTLPVIAESIVPTSPGGALQLIGAALVAIVAAVLVRITPSLVAAINTWVEQRMKLEIPEQARMLEIKAARYAIHYAEEQARKGLTAVAGTDPPGKIDHAVAWFLEYAERMKWNEWTADRAQRIIESVLNIERPVLDPPGKRARRNTPPPLPPGEGR
jgi:hypothetical protein